MEQVFEIDTEKTLNHNSTAIASDNDQDNLIERYKKFKSE
jgi:hypothetical protein